MSLAKDLDSLTTVPSWVSLPDEDDEWWSDEPELESSLHLEQILLLIACLKWWWRHRSRFFVAGNISIYYEKKQNKQGSHRFSGPDFFLVKDVSGHPRKSWMVWKEDNRFPNLIVEILSTRTAKVDRTNKKRLYQDTFKTPEYFWFHPWTLEFAGFKLVNGQYQSIPANTRGYLWSEELQLFVGVYERQLRFFTSTGDLVPIPPEVAIEAEQQLQLAEQQVGQERQQRELAEQQQKLAEQQLQLAEQQVGQERQKRELAERQQNLAEQQAAWERQKRELAQNQVTDLEILLEQYRNDLASLRDRLEDGEI